MIDRQSSFRAPRPFNSPPKRINLRQSGRSVADENVGEKTRDCLDISFHCVGGIDMEL